MITKVHLVESAAHHPGAGPGVGVGGVLHAVRAGGLRAQPVRRTQHAAAERRLLLRHLGPDAELQRRLHPDLRADVRGDVDLARPAQAGPGRRASSSRSA